MIDLRQSTSASPVVHSVPHDPGTSWASQSIAIDAPPDNDLNPSPAARWEAAAVRTGLCGAEADDPERAVAARWRLGLSPWRVAATECTTPRFCHELDFQTVRMTMAMPHRASSVRHRLTARRGTRNPVCDYRHKKGGQALLVSSRQRSYQ